MAHAPQPAEADPVQRIARLEAVEAIKALKHRYLRACDAKDPKAFRDCFVTAGATVDYGVLGSFDHPAHRRHLPDHPVGIRTPFGSRLHGTVSRGHGETVWGRWPRA